MKKEWLKAVCFFLLTTPVYAIDTYFPGEGPPSSADVQTEPPQYYVPQTPQDDTEETQYNNPTAPINPNQITPTPSNPVEGAS